MANPKDHIDTSSHNAFGNCGMLYATIITFVAMWGKLQCEADLCLSPLSLPGVEFSLPLASDPHPKAEKTSDTLDDSENEDESTASTWLCSMGIATQDFPAADTQTIALYPCHLKHTRVHIVYVACMYRPLSRN